MDFDPPNDATRVAVLGLGYVGLPLAHAFSSCYPTLGFDINEARVEEIKQGEDKTLALSPEELASAGDINYSHEAADLTGYDVYIITAPTPIDAQNQPDLDPVRKATALIARYVERGNVVIFESTVYPGATDEVCVPILEEITGLQVNRDFCVGYSPERVNPGDSGHSLLNIVKVTSGSSEESAEFIDALYKNVIPAGTHRASCIRVAEAAKVIENTQRDLNIALINELAVLFDKLDIDTKEVLEAAGSKWNFLPFSPGLVGGHCIGVDPYYLTYKAQQVGHHPEVILAGRRINDSMGIYVAEQVIRLMISRRIHILDARILIMGMTFKENCPDTRNSRVNDIIDHLLSYQCYLDVYDPWVEGCESDHLVQELKPAEYDAVIVAVAHSEFVAMGAEAIRGYLKSGGVLYDVKHLFPTAQTDGSL